MKEFIDKLIERLEYLRKDKYVLAPTVCYVLEGVKQYINQLAEEYNNKSVKGDLISRSAVIELIESKCVDGCLEQDDITLIDAYGLMDDVSDLPTAYNNGWIPYTTNGELPKEGQRVWLSFTNEMTSYVEGAWWQGKFFVWDNCHIVKDTPTAWKPYDIPEPYQPKGEEKWRF